MKRVRLRPLENTLNLSWYFSMKWGILPQRFNKVSPHYRNHLFLLTDGRRTPCTPPPAPLELAYHSLAPAHAEVEGNSTHRRENDKRRRILNLDTLEEAFQAFFPGSLQGLITKPSCEK